MGCIASAATRSNRTRVFCRKCGAARHARGIDDAARHTRDDMRRCQACRMNKVYHDQRVRTTMGHYPMCSLRCQRLVKPQSPRFNSTQLNSTRPFPTESRVQMVTHSSAQELCIHLHGHACATARLLQGCLYQQAVGAGLRTYGQYSYGI